MNATVKTLPNRITTWYGDKQVLTSYDVYLDGSRVGNVRKEVITRVSRTTGRSYEDLCWVYGPDTSTYDPRTTDERRDAIRLCLQNIGGVPFKEAELLAALIGSAR